LGYSGIWKILDVGANIAAFGYTIRPAVLVPYIIRDARKASDLPPSTGEGASQSHQRSVPSNCVKAISG
jgi:hypothetical protein